MMRVSQLFAFLTTMQVAMTGARAEPPAQAVPTRDAPSRAARLSFIEGTVSFQAAGSAAWGDGTLNRPITINDRVWADADSRAEVHLGSSALRLSSRTSLAVTNLDESTVQVSVNEGTIGVHIRDLPQGHLVEVDTPTAAITLRGVGAYRITVDPAANAAYVVVRRGSAEVLASGDAFEVSAHSLATVTGESGKTAHVLSAEPAVDGFDAWCDARDAREENPPALQYVSRDTVGYEDLDASGGWQQTPEYGPVWTPQGVDPTWAPYQDGRWSWMDPWGWTWIDAAAWGYAPFHYGRWVRWGSRWSWAPGPMVRSPVYAPALVGFIGTTGYGWGYRDPLVGWFPLGWNECYVPGYYASYRYVRQVNVNVVNVRTLNLANIHNTQVYMNRGVPGAVTTVPRGVMQGAQPVAGSRVAVPSGTMDRAPVTGFTARVAPQMASVIAAHAAHAQPPAATSARPVVTRNAPAPAAVPFATRAAALQNSSGRPMVNDFNGQRVSGLGGRTNMPPRPTAPGARPGAPVSHASVPVPIGPHNAPPRFSPPAVHNVQQPPHDGAPPVHYVQQPARYQGPSYTSSPRYNAPAPHYGAPTPHYAAPAPHYAPAPRIAPAPHSAPAARGRR